MRKRCMFISWRVQAHKKVSFVSSNYRIFYFLNKISSVIAIAKIHLIEKLPRNGQNDYVYKKHVMVSGGFIFSSNAERPRCQ